jgi:hypothetical protein
MVYTTNNYIRLFHKAQTFMRRHRLGAPRETWGLRSPSALRIQYAGKKLIFFDDRADILNNEI